LVRPNLTTVIDFIQLSEFDRLISILAFFRHLKFAQHVSRPESPYSSLDVEDVPDLKQEEEEGLQPKGGRTGGGGESDESEGSSDAFRALDALITRDGFDPDEPRDKDGKWSDTGGLGFKSAGAQRAKASTPEARL
jgi:hypothetical protein